MNADITTDSTIQPEAQITRFQCRHIHLTGHRCGSPCLKREDFCYYHHTTRKPVPKGEAQERIRARKAAFALPRPEDRAAIQAAIGEVLLRLAANELYPRRAGLLLYGLQIASINLPPRQPAADPAETVEDVIEHPELGLIAAPADFTKRQKRDKNLEEILMEQWAREEQREALADPTPKPEFTLDPESEPDDLTLPTLQAVADPLGGSTTSCCHSAAKRRNLHLLLPLPFCLSSFREAEGPGWTQTPSATNFIFREDVACHEATGICRWRIGSLSRPSYSWG